MFFRVTLSVFLGTLLLTPALQADMPEGKEMLDEAKCMECHVPSHFKHRDNKVNSYKKLSDSVRACATSSGAEWFDEDSDIVTEYLNKKHYHYKTPPKKEDDE
ncbi:MAG: hypothetical protein JXQ67_10725 [Campylobacterales bacterium]|nr:hypothetical protein [Campylobacterales bacterium]